MRKLTYVAAVLVALVVTGYAVADGIGGANNPSAVAGTFTATGTSSTSRTCTTSDNKTIVVTDGKYTGTASGDADLTGAITLRARSVVNTTDGVGVVSGTLSIDVSSGHNTNAFFTTAYDHGQVAGLATGRAFQPGAQLVANLSAGFDPSSGFTNGKIGGGTAGGTAVELTRGGCNGATQSSEHSAASGTISDLSSTSITVAGLTCAIPSDQSSDVNSKYAKGDTVTIRCSYSGGTDTLTSINGRKDKGSNGGTTTTSSNSTKSGFHKDKSHH